MLSDPGSEAMGLLTLITVCFDWGSEVMVTIYTFGSVSEDSGSRNAKTVLFFLVPENSKLGVWKKTFPESGSENSMLGTSKPEISDLGAEALELGVATRALSNSGTGALE